MIELTEYGKAEKRVNETPALEPYRDVILYDWPEGDEHWEWVQTATTRDILLWAEPILEDWEILGEMDAMEEEVA